MIISSGCQIFQVPIFTDSYWSGFFGFADEKFSICSPNSDSWLQEFVCLSRACFQEEEFIPETRTNQNPLTNVRANVHSSLFSYFSVISWHSCFVSHHFSCCSDFEQIYLILLFIYIFLQNSYLSLNYPSLRSWRDFGARVLLFWWRSRERIGEESRWICRSLARSRIPPATQARIIHERWTRNRMLALTLIISWISRVTTWHLKIDCNITNK